MRLRLLRPREVALALRDLARRKPREAEEYLESHHVEWESLARAEPHNAADILEAIEEETALDLVGDLDAEEAAEVVAEMRPEIAAELVGELEADVAASIVEHLPVDDAADIVGGLDAELRTPLLNALSAATAAELRGLLEYPPDSAGGLMTTEVAVLPIGLTAGEAIEALRRLQQSLEALSYVYVVDYESRLRGVLSFRELVFARPGTGLEEVAVEPVAVRPATDREDVAELIQRYGLLALPVVDHRSRLLGVVTVDDVITAIQEEAGEDIVAMVGAGVGETPHTAIGASVRHRLPWLAVNLATAFLVAAVISRFEPILDEFTVLAAYMPVVASMGGNGGAQAMAVVIRALATGDIARRRQMQVVGRQAVVGLAAGLALGASAGTIAGLFTGEPRIGVVLGVATITNLALAGFAGAAIPLILQRAGADPALASNIFLTTFTDLVGFGGFLTIAVWLLG
ncbi:MAG: magnesium transporter [Acidimicrobiia bacterium]